MKLLGLPPSLAADAAVRAVFSDEATVQAALDFEAALAGAETSCGVIPASAAAPITAACRAELYDLDALAAGALRAGTLAIPLVKRLGEEVARSDKTAAGWVHFGATSQDVLDTALVLQLRRAMPLLLGAGRGCGLAPASPRARAPGHAHAGPNPAPAGAADHLRAEGRRVARGRRARHGSAPAGGGRGVAVAIRRRGRNAVGAGGQGTGGCPRPRRCAGPAGSGGALAGPPRPAGDARLRNSVLAGSVGKIARDISLLMQAEVAEVQEPGGQGALGGGAGRAPCRTSAIPPPRSSHWQQTSACRACLPPSWVVCRVSTSARPALGRRRPPPMPSSCWRSLPRSRPWRRRWMACAWTRPPCARTWNGCVAW